MAETKTRWTRGSNYRSGYRLDVTGAIRWWAVVLDEHGEAEEQVGGGTAPTMTKAREAAWEACWNHRQRQHQDVLPMEEEWRIG